VAQEVNRVVDEGGMLVIDRKEGIVVMIRDGMLIISSRGFSECSVTSSPLLLGLYSVYGMIFGTRLLEGCEARLILELVLG
jgi:hypothetical protein